MSKTSKAFQETVKAELDRRASVDEAFAKSYAKEGKSIEECCDFIVGEVSNMGVNGLSDDEVYGLAIHYYDEDNITIKPVNGRVVVNHQVELSDEEKAEAKLAAMKRYEQEEYSRLEAECKSADKPAKKPKAATAKPTTTPAVSDPTLFDFGDETED